MMRWRKLTSKTMYGEELEIVEPDFKRWSRTIERESSKWMVSGDICFYSSLKFD